MTAAIMKNQGIEDELQLISHKLRFLVKICKEADNDTENRFCVELVGRELSAYAGAVDEMASGFKRPAGPVPTKPLSAPPLAGAKPLNPDSSRKPVAASPLDFPIDD